MKLWSSERLWLKLLSLVLAVITWFYIEGMLNHNVQQKKKIFSAAYYELDTKELPVVATITGKPSAGYEVDINAIQVEPATCVVSMPKEFFEYINFLKTEPVNVSDYTKTFVKNVGIEDIFNMKIQSEKVFKVTVPIKKQNVNDNETR